MFGKKSLLFLRDLNDQYTLGKYIIKKVYYDYLLLYIDVPEAETTAAKLDKIWTLACQSREKYNKEMIDCYAKAHNIFEYEI